MPETWPPLVYGFLLVLFRISALVALLPALGEASVRVRLKLAIAVSMTIMVFPLVEGTVPYFATDTIWIKTLVMEIGIGLWFGILLGVFVFCLQTAGSIAAQATSISQILGSAGVEPLPAMGHVITMAGMTLALTLGLHVHAVLYLLGSYTLFPTGQVPDLALVSESGVAQIALGFRLAFSLAAPFVILSILYNLTLGVINRAMPQLMVAFVGAPVITLGALVLLAISIPLMLSTWANALFEFLNSGFVS